MKLRNDRLAGVVMAIGLAALVGAGLTESARTAESEPGPSMRSAKTVLTPTLSVRRVPAVLVGPQASRRLSAKIAPILRLVPDTRCLVIADGSKSVVTDHADTPMPVASNQKIVTALTALEVLGPKTTLTTTIAATSAPTGGVVNGDLWFIGGGDPLIETDTYQAAQKYGRSPHTSLESIADKIVAAGVKSITGSVKGDDSAFDGVRSIPSWPTRYLRQNQVGPLSALAVNDARTYPVVIGAPSATPQPASDPAAYAADALRQLLIARGVTIAGPAASGTAPKDLTVVLNVDSLPIKDIVGEMLTYSDNNTAELMLKVLGVKSKKGGTTAAGIEVVRATLDKDSLTPNGLVINDGSGLDTGNRLTCSLLERALARNGPTGDLANGLAVADGPVGTLRDRYSGSPAAKKVRAKTGTLNGVSALSGWITTDRGAQVVFAYAINAPGRSVTASEIATEQSITEAILSYPDSIDPTTVEPKAAAGRG